MRSMEFPTADLIESLMARSMAVLNEESNGTFDGIFGGTFDGIFDETVDEMFAKAHPKECI